MGSGRGPSGRRLCRGALRQGEHAPRLTAPVKPRQISMPAHHLATPPRCRWTPSRPDLPRAPRRHPHATPPQARSGTPRRHASARTSVVLARLARAAHAHRRARHAVPPHLEEPALPGGSLRSGRRIRPGLWRSSRRTDTKALPRSNYSRIPRRDDTGFRSPAPGSDHLLERSESSDSEPIKRRLAVNHAPNAPIQYPTLLTPNGTVSTSLQTTKNAPITNAAIPGHHRSVNHFTYPSRRIVQTFPA